MYRNTDNIKSPSAPKLYDGARRYAQLAKNLQIKYQTENQRDESRGVSSQIATPSISTRNTNYSISDIYSSCAIGSVLAVIIGAALTPLSTMVGASIMTIGLMAFCTSAYKYVEHESQQQNKKISVSISGF